jgi:4-coumarate--CoA ligase
MLSVLPFVRPLICSGQVLFTHCNILYTLSQYHIYGLVKLVFNPFYRGAPQVIMSHFDPDAFCANVERYKVTVSLIVPPILVLLANHPGE